MTPARRADRRDARLLHEVVLAEELDGLVAGAMDAACSPRITPKRILEADLRAGIEAEEIAGQIAEIARRRAAGRNGG